MQLNLPKRDAGLIPDSLLNQVEIDHLLISFEGKKISMTYVKNGVSKDSNRGWKGGYKFYMKIKYQYISISYIGFSGVSLSAIESDLCPEMTHHFLN